MHRWRTTFHWLCLATLAPLPAPGIPDAAAQTSPAASALADRLAQVADQFAAGGTIVGSVRSGGLAEGEEKRIGLQMEGGKCYVFVAVGDPALEDLDMALETAGQRLGDDTRPDNYPTVRACTPARVRVEVVLTATRGAGSYLMALYDVPAEGDEAGTLAAVSLGTDIAERAVAIGLERSPGSALDGEIVRGHLVQEEVTALSRRLRGEICYTFVGVGGSGAGDLDIRVYVGSQKAGEDFGPGVEPVVVDFCPADDTNANIQIVMNQGNGDFAFAVFSKEATGALTEISQIDTAGLTRRLLRLAAERAAGMTPARSPDFGSLRHGRSQSITFATEAGKCYRVIGVTEPTIANLDLTLFVDGSSVAENTDPDATPVVGTCASAAGAARVDVWAVDGTGGFAVGVYEGTQPAAATAPAAPANPLETLLDAAATALSPGARRASTPYTGVLSVTGTQSYDITLQAGNCYAFVGVCDAGNLDIEVAQGTTVLGRDDDLDATPGVLYCPQAAMTIRAKLTLLSASANYAFGVYFAPSVQASTTQPTPTSTGIAVGGSETDYVANRIRALHQERAAALLPVSAPVRGDLQQAQQSEFLVNLPAGRCYTVVAAGMPSVRDLDITLTSPYGQVLATDSTDDANPVLVTNPCPQWSGDYRINVSMQYGYGTFAFQVFSQ